MKDIAAGLLSIFSINNILGIDPVTDTPEKQAKKKQIHQRWNALTQEQQQVAQQKYQENLQRKQRDEEERQMRKQQEEQERANSIQMPSSPQKGAQGPAGSSAKQKATNQLNTSRQQLSSPQSAN
jgi:hypothetical protein